MSVNDIHSQSCYDTTCPLRKGDDGCSVSACIKPQSTVTDMVSQTKITCFLQYGEHDIKNIIREITEAKKG